MSILQNLKWHLVYLSSNYPFSFRILVSRKLENKNNKRYWTPRELKKELNLELSEEDIFERLEILVSSDVIDQGSSDIRFCGLKDGTLNRVLRSRFQEESKTSSQISEVNLRNCWR